MNLDHNTTCEYLTNDDLVMRDAMAAMANDGLDITILFLDI